MLKIMLADDNQISLQYFKSLVDYRKLGFELVSAAGDGEEAYHDFLRYKPDVVITDIQMPCMDGIELASRITKENPDTIIIFLSSHQEFEYARAALNLKVNDYILKHETTKEKLAEKLTAIRSQNARLLESRRNNDERALYELLYDKPGRHGALHRSRDFFPGSYHPVLVEQRHTLPFVAKSLDIIDNEPSEFAVREMGYRDPNVKSILKVAPFRYLFLLEKDGHDLAGRMYDLKRTLEGGLDDEFILFVLEEAAKIDRCLKVFHECTDHLDRLSFFNHEDIIYSNVESLQRPTKQTDIKRLEDCIVNRNYVELLELASRNYNRILHDRDFLMFEKLSRLLLDVVISHEDINPIKPGEMDSQTGFSQWGKAQDFIHWIKGRLEILAGAMNANTINNYSREVEGVLRFISENYSDANITAQTIAEFANLSINGLNRVFKRETGDTVWKRLTKFRVEKARDLLEHKENKVSDVYVRVGFNSLSYFSTAFKKNFGYSPQEYKKKNEII